jgi:hypothetical protein
MRTIEDLEHFVLAEGESLILRLTRQVTNEQLHQMRETIGRFLPGRPVLVLPPEVEVYAGKLEVFGVDHGAGDELSTPTAEDVAAARKEIEDAYDSFRIVYVLEDGDRDWWYIQKHQNPHTFNWDRYNYSLTRPKADG